MTDVTDNELTVGTRVVFADRKHVGMMLGVITSFTANKVRVVSDKSNYERGYYADKVLKDPKHLSAIK